MAAYDGPMSVTMTPVRPTERIAFLDLLRGFALLGIVVVNSMTFFAPLYDQMLPDGTWGRPADLLTRLGITILFQGKFYTLFAFLFGVGAAIQKRRCMARGQAFVPFFWRRMAVLLLIGIAHGTLLWFGDILAMYAVCGFALAILVLLPALAQRLLAVTLLSIPLLFTVIIVIVLAMVAGTDASADITTMQAEQLESLRQLRDEAMQVYPAGSWTEILSVRLNQLGTLYRFTIVVLPAMLGLMLLGFQFGATHFFRDVDLHRARLLRWLPILAAVGVGLNVAGGWAHSNSDPLASDFYSVVLIVMFLLGAPALSATYAILLHRLTTSRLGIRLREPLAAVGRMALTNYLLQSVVMTTLANSWGFGLYGRVPPATGVVIAIALFVGQVVFSQWWLARFQMGPAERVWRTLTYGMGGLDGQATRS